MSCGHWLGARRVFTIARRTGLPVVRARRCMGYLEMADGRRVPYSFRGGFVIPTRDWPSWSARTGFKLTPHTAMLLTPGQRDRLVAALQSPPIQGTE